MKELSRQQIQLVENKVSLLIKKVNSFVIENIDSVEVASNFLKVIKNMENKIENKRLEFTSPLNQSLKAINDTFRKLKEPLEQARKSLANKILFWRKEEEEKIRKEEDRRRKIQKAHKKAGHEVKEIVELEKTKSTIGNTRARKIWTWEVIDFNKLDNHFKEVNTVAIRQAVKDGLRDTPGLKIYQTEQLTII